MGKTELSLSDVKRYKRLKNISGIIFSFAILLCTVASSLMVLHNNYLFLLIILPVIVIICAISIIFYRNAVEIIRDEYELTDEARDYLMRKLKRFSLIYKICVIVGIVFFLTGLMFLTIIWLFSAVEIVLGFVLMLACTGVGGFIMISSTVAKDTYYKILKLNEYNKDEY